ncbi:Aldehyde dehydrogenase [Methylophaga frappieri]|uniref:Aldehyde dehydrogenase n=1 Tax=Methylophaga frappieri (strain ATCC BAA-2434 / DSM 25690 / JAM7) TaxID=754477 RepID=I1YJV4_METFJ|nr:aldehyde dehydrogenase family protein [Methylophaga frappieri]AFJ03197.1 Aldehyde dehydrogenase [Methylophaga frappieri]
MSTLPHFALNIPGVQVGSGQSIEVTNPFSDAVLATVETADQQVVEQALSTAWQCFRKRDAWLPVPERLTILEKAMQLMQQQASTLAEGAAAEGGKPLVDSQVEIARCIDSIRQCIDTLRHQGAHPVPMGVNAASQHRLTLFQKEPIGVVVAISAFNHPLNLIAHQVGPAIAAGCPVIVKPAEATPLSCFRLVEIFYQAGLPAEWCQALLTDSHATAEKLATDKRVGFLSFIGSAKVGWYLRSKLAAGTRCALEHGGIAPVIIDKSANIDEIVPGLAKGGFYHAGQVCVSVQRVYVHKSIAKALADKLIDAAKAQRVGDPLSADTTVGPLIRAEEVDRVDRWVHDAVEQGASLLCGGQRLANHCYEPTVLFDPPATSVVTNQEIFGPVICLFPVDDIAHAVAAANDTDFAFQAAVYSQDIDQAMYAACRLDASAVMINEHTAFRVDWMPFAGLKHSGHGVGGIQYSMAEMQVDKMMVLSSRSIP